MKYLLLKYAINGIHLSGDLNEWLSIIESLENSSSKSFLDVLDGSGLGKINLVLTNYIFSAMFEYIIQSFKWNFDKGGKVNSAGYGPETPYVPPLQNS